MARDARHNDALAEMLLNVMQELWVVRDRQIVLEHVLEQAGIDVADAIDKLQPDEALAARLAEERQRLLANCLGPVHDLDGSE